MALPSGQPHLKHNLIMVRGPNASRYAWYKNTEKKIDFLGLNCTCKWIWWKKKGNSTFASKLDSHDIMYLSYSNCHIPTRPPKTCTHKFHSDGVKHHHHISMHSQSLLNLKITPNLWYAQACSHPHLKHAYSIATVLYIIIICRIKTCAHNIIPL